MSLNKNRNFNEYSPAEFPELKRRRKNRGYESIQDFIEKYVTPIASGKSSILNVGTAIDSIGFQAKNVQHFYVGNKKISCLTDVQAVYDIIVCNKSTLNNTDSMELLNELQMILRPGGLLALEFDNSNSLELLFKQGFNRKATFVYTPNERSWHYSDSWIRELLSLSDFEIIRKEKSNHFFTPHIKLTSSKHKKNIPSKIETLLQTVPILRNLASSTILLCQKKEVNREA